MPSRLKRTPAVGDLFGAAPDVPQGFAYRSEVLSATDERRLVEQFEALPFKPFEFQGFLANRRTVSFGYHYDFSLRRLDAASPMPDWLKPLQEIVGEVGGIAPEAFQQALVIEYAPGAGIGWHHDKPMFQDIAALSFLAPCTLRLRRREGEGWQRRSVEVEPRSCYVLRGAARDDWEHSIPELDQLRYSVTLRTFRPDAARPTRPASEL